jgi:hypothetical protein
VDWFPSVVAEHEGTLAFGFDAIAVAQRKQASPVRSFKRLLANVRGTPSITIGTPARCPTCLPSTSRRLPKPFAPAPT